MSPTYCPSYPRPVEIVVSQLQLDVGLSNFGRQHGIVSHSIFQTTSWLWSFYLIFVGSPSKGFYPLHRTRTLLRSSPPNKKTRVLFNIPLDVSTNVTTVRKGCVRYTCTSFNGPETLDKGCILLNTLQFVILILIVLRRSRNGYLRLRFLWSYMIQPLKN